METKNNVPYQTYKSRKHLRSQSSTPNASAAVTPDSHANSFFAHAAPQNVPETVPPQRLEPLIQPNISEMNTSVSAASKQLEASASTGAKSRNEPSVPVVFAPPAAPEIVLDTSTSTLTEESSISKQQTPQALPVALPNDQNHDTNDSSAKVASTSVVPTTPPTSVFRRIPSRTRTTSEHHSPLSRTTSAVANSPSFRRPPNSSRLRVSSDPSLALANSKPISTPPATVPDVLQPLPVHATQPTSNLLPTNPQSISAPATAHPSRPSSTVTSASSPSTSRRSISVLPYRPGFQPKGIYRQRTDDFIELRSSMRDKDKVEVRRLERRLEKLIQLHFSPESTSEKFPPSPGNNRRSMSFLELARNPSDIWRDVVETRMQTSKNNIRTEEQYITPWQPDSEVSQCPHCSASFHPLSNRKHHCRLCGRVVCSLPIKHPVRKQPCSILFVVDPKTSMIEEVGEVVDYGVRKRTSSNLNANNETERDDEKSLSGVRICRTCRFVLRRQQYHQEAGQTPVFVQLHDTLVNLEKEIEEALGKFQEAVISLSVSDPSFGATPDQSSAAALRKRLLEYFASYDRLSKRLAQLPATKGGSQERVQKAILSRATFFLQSNMVSLQALPQLQTSSSPNPRQVALEEDKRFAEALQPLLEQEALLEGFIEEAKAQRKFEDAKTLKINLQEIREEIKRVSSQAGAS